MYNSDKSNKCSRKNELELMKDRNQNIDKINDKKKVKNREERIR